MIYSALSGIKDIYGSGNQGEEIRSPLSPFPLVPQLVIGSSCQPDIAKFEFLAPRKVNILPNASVKFLINLKLHLTPAFFQIVMLVDQ